MITEGMQIDEKIAEPERRLVWIDYERNVGGVVPLQTVLVRPWNYGLTEGQAALLERGKRVYADNKGAGVAWAPEETSHVEK